MTYPPNNPGYPPAPQYGQPQQVNKPTLAAGAVEESKLPEFLLMGVAGLGLVAFIVSFFGLTDGGIFISGFDVDAALLAALVAGVSLVPKQANRTGIVAVISLFALLVAIANVVGAFDGLTWAYWVVFVLILVQAGVAATALLFDAGVLTPPAPKPQFDPQAPQYGQYGGPSQYYGQQSQPQGGPSYQQQPPQQRPGGYPSQYGNYPGGSNTGGFPVQNPQGGHSPQSGPPTPPTGFPAFGQPQPSNSNANEPTTAVPTQQPPTQPPSSQQSGNPQS